MDWPGWEKDEELAARHAKELRRQLRNAIDPHELITAWDRTYEIPSRWQAGDAEEFLYANGQSGKIQGVLSDVLDILWREAWELGVTSAMQVAGDTSQMALVKGGRVWKCDLGHKHDTPGAAGMLIRHKAPGEKRRYLLHKRTDDGTWVNFGGGLHPGESPWDGAQREVTEEAGKLPPDLRYRHTVIDDHGGWRHHMFVMDAPEQFNPSMDGETPDEVAGAAWFTKKEIRKLPLFHALRETWDTLRQAKDDTAINAAMHKAWRNPFSWAKPAPLPDDPWQDIRDQLQDAGVPAEVSGPLSSSYLTWESNQGATGIIGMVATLVGKLADILLRRRQGQITAQEAAAETDSTLGDESHALRIAATEAAKAINNAAAEAYIVTNNIEWVRWVTARDSKVCGACRANAAAGVVPIDRPFPSGSMMPPEHPFCRCVLVPAEPAPRTRHEEMINPLDWMPYESHKSAETPYLSTHHAPIGHEGLWHSKHPPLQLPAYIQQIRNALMRNGMGEREAHAMAVAAVERWAKGKLEWGPHRHVTPAVRAASADAVSQWEALRAHHP
jgi:SPP1 gp7 family putative phage head morphogenesis protein